MTQRRRFIGSIVDVRSLAAAIRLGERTCSEVLASCISRIEACEGEIRAWAYLDLQAACDEAQRLDVEISLGRCRGPLHGIPVGIKDLVDVAGMPTRGGAIPNPPLAQTDATIVARLRQAGAIILGKTVTTAWASFDPPPTRNPWDLTKTPGGSSSGSAAAIAAGMCHLAVGSQTGGSITRPASFCGDCGIKPTWGRVSTHRILPLAPSMDHIGLISRTVSGLGIGLSVISGRDQLDPFCSDLDPIGLPAMRTSPPVIGLLGGFFHHRADDSSREACELTARRLAHAGARVIRMELPVDWDEVIASHVAMMAAESATVNEARYRKHPEWYPERIRSLVESGLALSPTKYAAARFHHLKFWREIDQLRRSCDAWMCPATVGYAPDLSTTGDPLFNSLWSFSGLPSVNIPVHSHNGPMPLGIQLIGDRWGETELLSTAEWCERALFGME